MTNDKPLLQALEASNYALTQVHIGNALQKAEIVIGIGDFYGVDQPQEYSSARLMINAINAAEQAAAPPAPPTTPQQVAKYLTAAADMQARETARSEINAKLLLTWQRNAARAGLTAIPAVVAAIATRFDELLATFDELTAAPRTITGHENTEQFEQHKKLIRCCNDLTAAAIQRAQLADASGENADIGPDTLWLLVSPLPETSRADLGAAIIDYQSRLPTTVAEWDALRHFGLKLAQLGEVADRRQAWADFIWWIGHNTKDLGQLDHHLHEYLHPAPGSGLHHSRKMTVHEDELFV